MILDAAGRRWTILEMRLVALGARWRCRTRELVDRLRTWKTSSTSFRPRFPQSESGAVETTWIVLHEHVRGRIQPIETKITAEHSVPTSVRRCRIILEESFDLDHTHRLRGPDGTLYRITAVDGFPKLGELQTVDVEKIEASESLDSPSGVSLPDVPADTYLSYEVDRGEENIRVPGESLAVAQRGVGERLASDGRRSAGGLLGRNDGRRRAAGDDPPPHVASRGRSAVDGDSRVPRRIERKRVSRLPRRSNCCSTASAPRANSRARPRIPIRDSPGGWNTVSAKNR